MSSRPVHEVETQRAAGAAGPSVLDALRDTEGRLAVVLERLHDLVLYETGGGREFISGNVVHLLGFTAEQITADRTFFPSLIHDEDAAQAQARVRDWHARGSVGVLMSRFRVRRRDGEWIWIEDRMVQVAPSQGRPFMTGVLVDVTRQREIEEQIRAREERSNALLTALPDCIFLMDRSGVYLDYHAPPGARLVAPPERFLGRRMSDIMSYPGAADHFRLIDRTLDSRMMHMYEYDAGSAADRRHYEVRMVPCGSDRVLAIVRDVTERKRAEEAHRHGVERQRLMLNELDHRIRNNLAGLMSLIDLTAGEHDGDVAAFAATLRSRVAAMGNVHSLLSRVQWSPVRLGDLVREVIPPDLASRISAQGPEIRISPRQTTPLAMVLQELIFNSLKYGSLGAPAGTVALQWQVRNGECLEGDVALTIHWKEQGGPPPSQPPRLGAGTSLLTGLISSELRGRIDLAYPGPGADHLLTLSLDRI